jgi:hypothetical protein
MSGHFINSLFAHYTLRRERRRIALWAVARATISKSTKIGGNLQIEFNTLRMMEEFCEGRRKDKKKIVKQCAEKNWWKNLLVYISSLNFYKFKEVQFFHKNPANFTLITLQIDYFIQQNFSRRFLDINFHFFSSKQ